MDTTAASALVEIQGTLKTPKSKHNKFGGFDYRSKEDILEAIKPLIHPLGCYITVADEMVMIGERYYVRSTATLRHPASATEISVTAYAREPEMKKGMDDSQITGASASYAGKRALGNLFALDDTADADTYDNTQQKPKNGAQAANRQGKQQRAEDTTKRVEKGKKALEDLGVMSSEDIEAELNKLDSEQARLEWLTQAYINLKEGLE